MRKKLKLYVWEHVLTDWTSGLAVALARSPEEARELMHEAGLGCDSPRYRCDICRMEPDVYDEPSAFYVHGGG